MKKLLLIPLLLFCVTAFGQWTKPQLYSNINTNIRLKTYSPTRMAALLDSLVATMNTGGGGGAFTDLSDVPNSYSGQGSKLVRVNSGATALEFFTPTYLTSVGTGVANELTYWSGTSTLGSLSTATYPSLTELSYVKGVTSGLQTQLNAKLTDPMTTRGDIIYRNSSNVTTRLPVGANTYVLTSDGTDLSWQAPTGGGGLIVGTSTITSGTNTRVLYNNSGILGEYTISGTGNVAMTTSPTFTTPALGTPSSGTLTNTTGYLINNLAAATSSNTINNAANAQEWQWNTLGSGNGLYLTSSSTAATSNTQTLFNIALSGANSTSTQTTYGARISNSHTGTSSTNYALQVSASGGTTNYGLGILSGGVLLNQGVGQEIAKTGGILTISTGGDTFILKVGSTNAWTLNGSTGGHIFTPIGGATNLSGQFTFGIGGVSRTNQAASTELINTNFAANTITFQTGAIATQRNYNIAAPTYGFNGASTITNAYTFYVGGGPTAGTNATITNAWSAGFGGNINIAGSIVAGAVTSLNTGSIIHARGSGTSTNKTVLVEDSGGTDVFYVQDDGDVAIPITPTKDNAATQVLTRNTSNGVIEYRDAGVTYSTSNMGIETVAINFGDIGASTTSSNSIKVNAYYSNETTVLAEITVVGIKTDGTASVHATAVARFRKNSSGTFSVDDAGTVTTSDATVISDLEGEINGTNPSVKLVTGASASTYQFTCKVETTWATD